MQIQRNLSYIPALSITAGTKIHKSLEIAESLRAFYAALYNLHSLTPMDQPPDRLEAIDAHLGAANLPSLNAEEVELLSQPISKEGTYKHPGWVPKGENAFP